MQQNDKILVIGANGTVGRELAKNLEKAGRAVVRATSKEAKAGQVKINLATGDGIKAAFEGIDKAFVMAPPRYADQYKILAPLIQEAKRRGLKKVVLLSAMGVDSAEGSPFRRAEQELERSGLTYNIVRPNWFIQNFANFWGPAIKASGKVRLPAREAKTSFIDARDISEVVAKLLTSNEHENTAIDLTGPEALDHNEIAGLISKATGKKIPYENVPPQALGDSLVNAGLPKDYVAFLLTIFGFLSEGYNARITDGVKRVLGREPRSVNGYFSENKLAWI